MVGFVLFVVFGDCFYFLFFWTGCFLLLFLSLLIGFVILFLGHVFFYYIFRTGRLFCFALSVWPLLLYQLLDQSTKKVERHFINIFSLFFTSLIL